MRGSTDQKRYTIVDEASACWLTAGMGKTHSKADGEMIAILAGVSWVMRNIL